MDKKIRFSEELAYLIVIVLQGLGVALMSAADFGLSVAVAPAYIVSLKVDALTFGQAEWVFQGILFVVACLLLGKMKVSYLLSFFTAVFYGAVLDVWRMVIPALNPSVTPPGAESFGTPLRLVFFLIGSFLVQFTVALSYWTWIEPMVYDFFTVKVSDRFHINRTLFKRLYDLGSFLICLTLTFLFFGKIRGIGVGSVILVFFNGIGIGYCDRFLERHFDFQPTLKKLSERIKAH